MELFLFLFIGLIVFVIAVLGTFGDLFYPKDKPGTKNINDGNSKRLVGRIGQIFTVMGSALMGIPSLLLGSSRKRSQECWICFDLLQSKEIKSEQQFGQVIKLLKSRISKGTYKDVTQPQDLASIDFLDLPVSSPWPDTIEYHFKCKDCGGKVRLVADNNGSKRLIISKVG